MEINGDPSDGRWVYVPSSASPDPHAYTDLGEMTVDGETFAVRRRDDGALHYDWVSGPNEGYGFSVFGRWGPVARHSYDDDIREFLGGIDPTTGYLSYP